MNKLIVFYFSGTGNARNVSKWIKQVAEENQFLVELLDISKLKSRKIKNDFKNAIIGFCSPTHGFNFPPIMLHFIIRFPRSKHNKAFIINTRAGTKMGKLFLPGLSGLTQVLSVLILKIKAYKIIGMKPIDLPSNWISAHPAIKPEVVQSIYNKRKEETSLFSLKILNNKKVYSGLYTLPIDLLISPVAVLYYLIGRFVLAKTFYATQKCTMCELCIKKCPVQAIKSVGKRPFWTYKCESCMQCMNICPERAIETSHGFSIGIYYLISSILIIQVYKLIGIRKLLDLIDPVWFGDLLGFIIDSVLLLSFFFLAYRIFHYLLRFKIFEKVVNYTSLTYFKFWRRYKTPK